MRIVAALLLALVLLGCDYFGPQPYACGGTHTVTPDGVLHCTGGVP